MTDSAITRLHERVDDHATRLGQLEGWVKSLQSIQQRQDDRIEKVEQTSQQVLLSLTQVQGQLTHIEKQYFSLEKTIADEGKENRKLIEKLLDYDQKRDEQLSNASEADKGRRFELLLKVWGVLGPVIAAGLTVLFGGK